MPRVARVCISRRALTIQNTPNSAIPFGAHSRPMSMLDRCQRAVALLRLVCADAVDGLAKSDATDRSHLHSRKDACTFAGHASLDLPQERRGIRSAPALVGPK